MNEKQTNRHGQFLIDIPMDQVEAVFQAINNLGIKQNPQDQAAHLEYWKGAYCHALFGYDLDSLAQSINDLLNEHGFTPGIAEDREDWNLEQRIEFLEMAASHFGWHGSRTEEPHWHGEPETEFQWLTQDYPWLFTGDETNR